MFRKLLRKRKGQVGWVTSLFLMLFIVVFAMYHLQVSHYDAIRTSVQDALAASNLASAVIDIEQYGIDHKIVVTDTDGAYARYLSALRADMGLDDNYLDPSGFFTSGRVDVLEYTVYNVRGDDVEVVRYGQSPSRQTFYNGKGSVVSPNGSVILETSIYSRITFPVDALFGVSTVADMDQLVDIVRQDV